ncbi:hypothetical protein TeGR_g6577 [Tetraparma gracilis]|uniref:Helicase ATP-binding domain-containing protein n=1 Tax=Tetraparma gracilis TaxID=2962635 RepID=A0ABQ6N1F4_9STRA|nr:hypothetical protein TeGR_g6577 [Tetraparma gracilis]
MASTSTENVPPPAPSAPGSKLSAPGSAPAAAAPDHAPEPSAAEDDETGSQVSQDEEDLMLAKLEAEDLSAPSAAAPTHAPTLLGGGQDAGESKKSQLDFLLNKASEYSQFIAGDLKELQNQMAEKAAAEADSSTPKGKKRGKSASPLPSKRGPGASKPIFTQPRVLSKGCQLKDYQLEGVRWLASLYENGVSGILADEMGLGKTIQVIGLVAHLMTVNVVGPFLVVAPLATLPNWVREFEKWLPSLPVVRYHGSAAERGAFWVHEDGEGRNVAPLQKKNRKDPKFPVVITSYEVAIRDMKKLSTLAPFQYMIVDEGQRLKNRKCCLIKNLKMIRADNRLLLSGTPIQNNLDELWSLLNFVNPQIFDDLTVFQSWFGFKDIGGTTADATDEASIIESQKSSNIVAKLHEILRPFLLRRVKTDVLKEMPPKKEIVVYAGMSQLQRGYAANIDKGVLREELMKSGIEGAHMTSQINALMNHRKNRCMEWKDSAWTANINMPVEDNKIAGANVSVKREVNF